MNRHDVLMRQRTRGSRFAQEALANGRIGREVWRERFDCHVTVEPDVVREVHDAHAAATDLSLDVVLTGERRGEGAGHPEARAANAAIARRV
jgi:hypothetical protein